MLTGRLRARRLYAEPGEQEVGLSPTGNRVSMVSRRRGGGDRLLLRGDRGRAPARTVASFAGGISGHAWSPDGRSVLLTAAARRGGTERLWRLPLSGTSRTGPPVPVPVPGDPGSAVLLDRDQPRRHGLPVRTTTGSLAQVHLVGPDGRTTRLGPPADLDRWLLDGADRLRAGTRWELDGTLVVLVPEPPGWRELTRLPPPESLLTYPAELSADGDRLLLTGPLGADDLAVGELDLSTGAVRTLVREPGRDIDAVVLHPVDRHPQLLRLAGLRPEHRALDPAAAGDLDRVAAAYGGRPRLVAAAGDDSAWLVRTSDDVRPDRTLVWDRARVRAHPLTTPPRPGRAARTLPFRFAASDGLELRGYLTLPARPGPAPTVLLVHGGPWARDEWGFDPDVQWYAAHGYACVQVGFRGSEGRGAAFLGAADQDWGGRMQTDLVDTARWAVAEGYADPGRLAIQGHSYGGYAALAAATLGPPVFAAAVAICAASDLVALTRPMPAHRSYLHALFLTRLGHPDRDVDRLRERSPLTHAAAAHTPVLLAHGALDPLMRLDQAERMAAALRAHDRPHRTLVFPDEGHGIRRPANRRRLAREAHRFLTAHTRTPPAPEVTR